MVSDKVSHSPTPEICILESCCVKTNPSSALGQGDRTRRVVPIAISGTQNFTAVRATAAADHTRCLQWQAETLLRRLQHKAPAADVKPSSSSEPGKWSESNLSTARSLVTCLDESLLCVPFSVILPWQRCTGT
ncbi:hypothetical protein DPSP01_013223 [Paraphaeosphaeria sporulosa]